MKRKLLVILAVFAMALTFAPVVSATTQGTCSGSSTSIRLWENAPTDTSDGNDTLYAICKYGTGIPDLSGTHHDPTGYCNNGTPFHVGDSWNDCIDSVTINLLNSNLYRLCAYDDANYQGVILLSISGTSVYNHTRVDLGGNPQRDHMSSVRVRYLSTGC